MVKRLIMVLVLVSLIGGGLFAQSDLFDLSSGPTPQDSVVFVDLGYTLAYLFLGGFGIGLGYESRINDNSTWLVNGGFGIWGFKYIGYEYSAFEFNIEGNYRYYFFGTAVDKLFVNAGLGYTGTTQTYSGLYTDKYNWGKLSIPLYAGWKAIFSPGFVVEVNLGYRIGINIIKPTSSRETLNYNGLISGIRLGWAF